jgi:triphosphoribosyl-dephospho-CoA synthase
MRIDQLFPFDRRWEIPEAVSMALLLEASAAKAGNVHPAAAFADMNYAHFVATASAVGRNFGAAANTSEFTTGALILQAVRAMQTAASRNTILGSILLFGPIVTTKLQNLPCSRASLSNVLNSLTPPDSQLVYQAIREAQPGGLGKASANDVAGEAPDNLLQAMAQVASFDAVARQYTHGYQDILECTLPWLNEELRRSTDLLDAICRLQLRWLAHEPDGLIIRKCGIDEARAVQHAAQQVWQEIHGVCSPVAESHSFRAFDTTLRSNGNRLNPGTTADLIAATLLVGLLQH